MLGDDGRLSTRASYTTWPNDARPTDAGQRPVLDSGSYAPLMDRGLWNIAAHEAGHALLGWLVGIHITRVTILPTSTTGGHCGWIRRRHHRLHREFGVRIVPDEDAVLALFLGGDAADAMLQRRSAPKAAWFRTVDGTHAWGVATRSRHVATADEALQVLHAAHAHAIATLAVPSAERAWRTLTEDLYGLRDVPGEHVAEVFGRMVPGQRVGAPTKIDVTMMPRFPLPAMVATTAAVAASRLPTAERPDKDGRLERARIRLRQLHHRRA